MSGLYHDRLGEEDFFNIFWSEVMFCNMGEIAVRFRVPKHIVVRH